MSSEIELGQELTGKVRAEDATTDPSATSTIKGTARSDSSGGKVDVYVDGVTVPLATECPVVNGDKVSIRVVDGKMTVVGVVGRGDDLVEGIYAAQDTADTAYLNIEDLLTYVWHDNNEMHLTNTQKIQIATAENYYTPTLLMESEGTTPTASAQIRLGTEKAGIWIDAYIAGTSFPVSLERVGYYGLLGEHQFDTMYDDIKDLKDTYKPAAMTLYHSNVTLSTTSQPVPFAAIASQSRAGLLTLSGGILTAQRKLYVTGVSTIRPLSVNTGDWIVINMILPMRGIFEGPWPNPDEYVTFCYGGTVNAGQTVQINIANASGNRGTIHGTQSTTTLNILPI
jgi:hypothetical protein